MVVRYIAALGTGRPKCGTPIALVLLAYFSTGCVEEPRPRSYMEFIEDTIAREGTLSRCNRDREATAREAECMNARRAASTIAARADEALREQREAESEAQLAAARERAEREQIAIRQTRAAAEANAEAEYEAQWTEPVILEDTMQLANATSDNDGIYGSLASTLDTANQAPEPGAAEAPAPPYVELPAGVERRELPPEPVLEGISIPESITHIE